jgi:hypothetical protein
MELSIYWYTAGPLKYRSLQKLEVFSNPSRPCVMFIRVLAAIPHNSIIEFFYRFDQAMAEISEAVCIR